MRCRGFIRPIAALGAMVLALLALRAPAHRPARAGEAPSPPSPAPPSPQAIVEAAWKAVADYYFDPDFGGRNWESVRARYLDEAGRPGADPYQVAARMLAELGPNGAFIVTPQQAQLLEPAPLREEVVGVGIVIVGMEQGGVLVRRVIPGGPAAQGGVRRGDRIVAVDGVPTQGRTQEEVAEAIRGKQGTTVTLDLVSPDGSRRRVSLVRRKYTFESRVEARVLPGNVGYLYLPHALRGVETAFLGELRRLYRTRALILDLRESAPVGGGLADLATLSHIAGLLMTEPLGVVMQRDQVALVPSRKAAESDNPLIPAPTDLDFYSRPMAVLIDETTRLHELAFALQQTRRAVLVGRPTGPGGGQYSVVVPLPGGGAVVVSAARFYSVRGQPLVGQVVPDVVVPMDEAFLKRWGEGGDRDIDRALEALERQQQAQGPQQARA